MGSTCSTLDAPRGGRVSQIAEEQREKDAAALEYEIARWMEADAECRGLQTDVTFDPRECINQLVAARRAARRVSSCSSP